MTAIERLKEADKTLSADGYNEWSYVRLAISEAIKAMTPTPTDAISAENQTAGEKKPEDFLGRGTGHYINCTDYDDAIEALKKYAKYYYTLRLRELDKEVPDDQYIYEHFRSIQGSEYFRSEDRRHGAIWMRDKLSPVLSSLRSEIAAIKERYFNIHVDHDRMKQITIPALTEENARLRAENDLLKRVTRKDTEQIYILQKSLKDESDTCELKDKAIARLKEEKEELKLALSNVLCLFPSNEIMESLLPDSGDKTIRKYGILFEHQPTHQQIEQWRQSLSPSGGKLGLSSI